MTEKLNQTIIEMIPNCTIGENCNVTMPLSCEGQDKVNANGTYLLAYRIELYSCAKIKEITNLERNSEYPI